MTGHLCRNWGTMDFGSSEWRDSANNVKHTDMETLKELKKKQRW